MLTHDLKRRFTPDEALEFFQNEYSKLTEQQLNCLTYSHPFQDGAYIDCWHRLPLIWMKNGPATYAMVISFSSLAMEKKANGARSSLDTAPFRPDHLSPTSSQVATGNVFEAMELDFIFCML